MIVCCPACGTLYRCATSASGSQARCSACSAAVPIASRRQYAVHSLTYAEAYAAADAWGGRRPTATVALPRGAVRGTASMRSVANAGSAVSGMSTFDGGVRDSDHADAVGDPAAASGAAGTASNRSSAAGRFIALILGAVAGTLGGFGGASQLGGSMLAWCAGGAAVGAVAALAIKGPWTSRNA